MSLRDAIEQTRSVPTPPKCRVGITLVELDDDDRAELLAALNDPTLTSVAIAAAVQSIGVDLAEYSVQRHRRGACLCPR